MKSIFNAPKTTLGGVVCLVAVALLLLGKIDPTGAVAILGLAGGWIGAVSDDHKA